MNLDPNFTTPPTDSLFRMAVDTKLTYQEAAYQLQQAWKTLFCTNITDDQLGIIWAHGAVETAGFTLMKNWNFGNIRKRASQLYTSYKCHEYHNDGTIVEYIPFNPKSFFCAWETVESGLQYYLNFLQEDRYKKAFDQLIAGNMIAYVRELKIGGYFTADLEAYTKAVATRNVEFIRNKTNILNYTPPAPIKEIVPEKSEKPALTIKPDAWLKISQFINNLLRIKK
jgi:hypothetical protein